MKKGAIGILMGFMVLLLVGLAYANSPTITDAGTDKSGFVTLFSTVTMTTNISHDDNNGTGGADNNISNMYVCATNAFTASGCTGNQLCKDTTARYGNATASCSFTVNMTNFKTSGNQNVYVFALDVNSSDLATVFTTNFSRAGNILVEDEPTIAVTQVVQQAGQGVKADKTILAVLGIAGLGAIYWLFIKK